ncbi:methyl-accepting chemotaxis protein [Chromobacterium piscinae]|uniref:methyl-accepting chemotaxis protein n=1 Tax=Chromobacterium piscinae TaxID=686831 RepID=UPI001C8B5ACA|nr:methyl-accepting chemotaxis protein [Chromobacterium piscinae]MBX9295264.1 methyl-accepting chemotaxis protein [Chromobacterium vaccinii]MBX9356895.1 methyl-accepting chemotaxis protein [Chromobacterium vaccinii]MCD4505994.1 methyl-accepting chemotaxis protein [Chromobacterium piscinae]MCD5327210.1 methyl-accepting chemotaxis protein [Chromobacterium piscinae]
MANAGMSLKARLVGLMALVVAVVCGLGVVSVYNQRQVMLQDRQDKVRNLVQSAVGLVSSYEKLVESGKIGEADAKRMLSKALSSMHYEKADYFFAYDSDWNYVAHGAKPELIGKNLAGVKDPNGIELKTLFQNAISSPGGGGYGEYVWSKPGFDQPQPKISYVTTTPKWHWIVGTGIYLDDVSAAFHRELLWLGGVLAAALLVLLGMGGMILRNVLSQLGADPQETVAVVKRIAAGHLDEDVAVREGDQESLMSAVGAMQRELERLVRDIIDGANQLSQVSSKVTGEAEAVGRGSEQQSAAATAMAASIEQLTVSVNHISDRSQDARNLANESGTLSKSGGAVIAEAVSEMRRINDAVDQTSGIITSLADKTQTISSIMQVIKDIADQTNLLALNAAIEAARAGEMGRGFAVVADEVRKLSERTAQATQEIASMIQDVQQGAEHSRHSMEEAVSRVKAGLGLAEQAGSEIARIQDSASGVVAVIGDISHALQEQSAASQTIAQHVEQIAHSATSNASASQSASQAIHNMHQLAANLRQLVSRFSVRG